MRMIPLLTVVVAFGLAFSVLGAVGVSDILGEDRAELEQEINDRTADPGTDKTGSERTIEPNEESGFFDLAVDAVNNIRNMLGLLFFLDTALANLGMPVAAANAINRGLQLVVTIVLIQIALQYTIR